MSRSENERDALLRDLEAERDAIELLDRDRAKRSERRDDLVRALARLREEIRPTVRELGRAAGVSKPWITKIVREDD